GRLISRHRPPGHHRGLRRASPRRNMTATTAPAYTSLTPPTSGEPITMHNGTLSVPDQPIIPFIERDGTGPDIWRAAKHVFDRAVEAAYGGKRQIVWFEVLAGEKSKHQ